MPASPAAGVRAGKTRTSTSRSGSLDTLTRVRPTWSAPTRTKIATSATTPAAAKPKTEDSREGPPTTPMEADLMLLGCAEDGLAGARQLTRAYLDERREEHLQVIVRSRNRLRIGRVRRELPDA